MNQTRASESKRSKNHHRQDEHEQQRTQKDDEPRLQWARTDQPQHNEECNTENSWERVTHDDQGPHEHELGCGFASAHRIAIVCPTNKLEEPKGAAHSPARSATATPVAFVAYSQLALDRRPGLLPCGDGLIEDLDS